MMIQSVRCLDASRTAIALYSPQISLKTLIFLFHYSSFHFIADPVFINKSIFVG